MSGVASLERDNAMAPKALASSAATQSRIADAAIARLFLQPDTAAAAGTGRVRTNQLDPGLAQEIAACARLVRGYGDTHRRGVEHFARIRAALIAPALDGRMASSHAADAIASARVAALADPDGARLADVLAAATEPGLRAAE